MAAGTATTNQIDVITFDFKLIQRTNAPIALTATIPGSVQITSVSWEIRDMTSNVLYGLSFDRVASIPAITTVGWYKVIFTAKTATDQYIKTWDDMRVFTPQFTEGEADIVVNLASGNYYNNFALADNSDLKIYVKGSGTAQFSVAQLTGTDGHPVVIQKEIGNTNISLSNTGAHVIYLQLHNAHIVFDGFNTDGTNGWDVIGGTGVTQIITAKDAHFTNLEFMGMNLSRTVHVQAASFSFIPVTNVTYNASNWVTDDMVVFHCDIYDAGDEGIYMGYNSDALQGGYRPSKFRDAIIAWNNIYDSGRDGIQPGGCVNIRVHNNYIDNWGLNHDTSHESAISWNGGNYGKCYNNYMINGEMFLNIQSGETPWDIQAGQTTPQKVEFFSNVGINGTYTAGGSTEDFDVYIQTSSIATSSSNWPMEFYNNTFKCDKKFSEAFFHASSFTWTGFKFVNNVIVKVGTAGDGEEYNFTGAGTQPTGSTINNLVRNNGSESDILFTNYAGNDLTISSLSSPVYTGATDVSSYAGDYDYLGFPLSASGFAYGAYSGYQKKTITPTAGDPNPATFSVALAVGTLTQSGGTITFEANKVGVLYWAIVANNATAPTEAQLRAGGHGLASGAILDSGTAGSYVVSTLTEGTAYDLHGIFVTVDNIPQASVTKVDFTTTADTTAPTLSGWNIADANRDRVNFTSSEVITGTTYGGFTIATPTKTINAININSGSTTGHYFTVSVPFVYGEAPTIAYSGSGSNIKDVSVSQNSLASFTAVSITNNIAAAPEEYVVWADIVNATDDGNGDLTNTTSSANARSTKIIPSASNGYIVYTWHASSQTNGTGIGSRFGLIGSSDARTAANLKMALEFLSTTGNIDVYQGTTYKATISAGTGIQATGYRHRFRIDRGTSKVYYETSPDGTSWTLRYTHDGTVTGDLKAGYVSDKYPAGMKAGKIQADLGLN